MRERLLPAMRHSVGLPEGMQRVAHLVFPHLPVIFLVHILSLELTESTSDIIPIFIANRREES